MFLATKIFPGKRFMFRNVRSPFSAARVFLCRAELFGAVVKVLLVLEAMRRRIIDAFGDECLSRQLTYASGFTVTLERVTWISEGFY